MKKISNEMILASAGSGKTYALTTRFIKLLAAGVAPERITALTFTRKAAGEFFDEILRRLAGAASSENEAVKLAEEVEQPGMDRAGFAGLLRQMIDAMPRLTLGTMDSFFARIVSAFPFELGLAGEIRMLDEARAAEETRRALGRFFAGTNNRGEDQNAVLEAFRFATMGVESKSVASVFDEFIADYMELFRRNSEPDAWGSRARIWPDGFPWSRGDAPPEKNLSVLCAWLDADSAMTDGQRKRWLDFAEAFSSWAPGITWPKPLEYMVGAVLKTGPEFEQGNAEITVDRRRQTPPKEVCVAVVSLVRRVVEIELGRRMAVTKGIGSLLRRFDAAYDSQVRRTGMLTFSDVLELLGASGIVADSQHDSEARRSIDFRLDGRVDHWLLDEFQDTSRRQWDVLEGLVDEAVQDPSGARSLFYVGDVKQAIFSWRGGDPHLFEHVAARYSAGGPRAIERRELNRSFRSGKAIIELVNRVFGSPAIGNVLPEAAPLWTKIWRAHSSAVPERLGQAAVIHAADADARRRTMLDLVREIDPIRRGFSCAVLVRKNSTATELAEFLRREGHIPAVAESDLHFGRDNPWAAAFVSLLQCAAHPGDAISWEHLKMTPAWEWLLTLGVDSCDALVQWVLGCLGREGYEALAAAWFDGLRGVLDEEDEFTKQRAGQLIAAAREFDEAGGGTAAAFIRHLGDATVRETEGTDVVRVMTIHKSKGLGFDVVILPDLEGPGLAARRDGPAVATNEDGGIDWILEFPGSLIAENDECLGAYLKDAKTDAAFDSLARLYVAMTRAKQGLFAIIEPAGNSKACSYPRLLTGCLGTTEGELLVGTKRFPAIAPAGDDRWILPGTEVPKVPEWSAETVGAEVAVNRLERKVASDYVDHASSLADVFGASMRVRAGHGTAVHELLAKIEWSDSVDIDRWAESATNEGADPAAVKEAVSALMRPEFETVFVRPGKDWEAWRERALEAMVDGVWVSAVIDRACIRKNAEGAIEEARVFEFKTGTLARTGHGAEPPRGHVDQLAANRRVIAEATGLPVQKVEAFLVYTGSGNLVDLTGRGQPD